MRFRTLISIILASGLITGGALADTVQEIDHLLDFVNGSKCQFDRNGTIHSGPEARDHINRKYEYYRDEVTSTEDFIKYSATSSKLSGRRYKVRCPGSTVMNTSDWLLDELTRFRKDGAG